MMCLHPRCLCIMLGLVDNMAHSEFSIPVHDLDAAGKRFELVITADWLRLALAGTDAGPGLRDGKLDVRLSKSGTDVVVRGEFTAEVTVACARCLEPARVAVREPVNALVVAEGSSSGAPTPAGDPDGDAGESGDLVTDQADVISYDGDTVVLDTLVRDELLLGIPMIPLCSEACTGIRPESSPESSPEGGIDPRLRPLLRIKKSLT
jgi:uncharacterized protein